MATSSYTPNLGLCSWLSSDRPKREDFVSDNSIIDNVVGQHIGNTAIHMSAAEKQKALEPYLVMIYAGDGTDNRAVVAGFQPSLAIVIKKNAALTENDSGATVVNSGMAAYGRGGSAGIAINSEGFVVRQQSTAGDGMRFSLNETGSQYIAVVFR